MIKKISAFALSMFFVLLCGDANAINHGFDPLSITTKWFEKLKIPPKGMVSCCGRADAYSVDRYEKLPSGDYLVWIADGDPILFPDGTRRIGWDISIPIVVPAEHVNDMEDDLDNPTEHSWLFFIPVREYPQDGGESPPSNKVSTLYCFIRHPNGT
jgi:hypothetical protein